MPVTASPQVPNFGIINGVPGLGFDYPHLAAINRGFNNQFGFQNAFNSAFVNNSNGFIIPFFGGGVPSYYPAYDEEPPGDNDNAQRAQQPIYVLPSPQQTPAASAASAPPATQAPPPELGQLILVRHDGQIVMAVAFTVRNGQLTYVTNEGTRRSFPVSELDKETTRQMNEANGTFVSIPN